MSDVTPYLTDERLRRATVILARLIVAGIISRDQPPESVDFSFV